MKLENLLWRSVCLLLCASIGNGLSSRLLAQGIVVESVLLSTIDSANIPARDVGVLEEMLVKEGDVVEKGAPLARLDDVESKLSRELTQLELDIAQLEKNSDLRVEYALKAVKVAEAELKRSLDANRKFQESVSQTEIDRLELLAQKAGLDVRLARHEQQITGMNAALKSVQFKISEHKLKRLTMVAPIAGTVVELKRNAGEWVEPGDVLVRIISIDKLRGEAVLSGKYRHLKLKGRKISVQLPGQSEATEAVIGQVTFVRPEIDPVDGSFRVRVEVDNSSGVLRPGDSVTITIFPEDETDGNN